MEVILDSWRTLEFRLHRSPILENHLHLVARSPGLDKDGKRFKAFAAKRLIETLETAKAERLPCMLRLFKAKYKVQSTYQVWEESSHPPRNEDEDVMRQKLDYLHFNPVKRGYVDGSEHWCRSSARNHLGEPGIKVDTAWLGS